LKHYASLSCLFFECDVLKQFQYKCRGEKAKITLWGDLAHVLTEKVIEKHTNVVVMSAMVISPWYKSKFLFIVV
jgi:hypothetical protein